VYLIFSLISSFLAYMAYEQGKKQEASPELQKTLKFSFYVSIAFLFIKPPK